MTRPPPRRKKKRKRRGKQGLEIGLRLAYGDAMTERFIYKICARAEWKAAVEAGVYQGSEVDAKDGFIHFSTAGQSVETASKHFSGVEGLVLVRIDGERLGEALKWEVSRNGDLFPHLYGVLAPDTVEFVVDLPLGADGKHVFPPID
jgi:uncharacterized protein (DUF952 family)